MWRLDRIFTLIVQKLRSYCADDNRLNNLHNLLSLPTCITHTILTDWVDAFSVIKLDFALDRDESLHLTVVDILQTGHFHLKKVKRIRNWTDWTNPSPPTNVNTKVLNWLILRQVKVLDLELHELSCKAVLGTYLAKFGEHMRHIYPCEDCERFGESYQSQNALIAKHCHNLIRYTVCSYGCHVSHILSVLANNVHLQDLYIYGGLRQRNNLTTNCEFTLPNLTQLKWGDKYGLDYDLVALVEAAPNLQKIAIFSERSSALDGEVALDLARACCQLRTFSCKELHVGYKDINLKVFLASCRHIVNLDLSRHDGLTDTFLIEALSELIGLYCLDLRGCCQLTDHTLNFLAQRFASTLKVLYLDPQYGVGIIEQLPGRYTAAGIANLRAQCIHLHTFRYILETGRCNPSIEAYRHATLVNIMHSSAIPLVLEHSTQIEILSYDSDREWITVDQLMTIAGRCPHLHTIVLVRNKVEVDYRDVKKAFPKLIFTADTTMVDFDMLLMPV